MRVLCIVLVICVGCTRGESSSAKGSAGNDKGGDGAAEAFAPDDRDAVGKAVEKATGRALDEDDCVVWPRSFPRVVLVGGFAHDRGCMHAGSFVGRTWYENGGDRQGLATVGWDEAGIEKRQELAKAWVEEVFQAFGGNFVDEATTAFTFDDTPDFEPVKVRATKVGGVVVSGWVSEPAGMVWESAYRFEEYRFGPDGSVETASSRRFSVEGERIQAAEKSANEDDSADDG